MFTRTINELGAHIVYYFIEYYDLMIANFIMESAKSSVYAESYTLHTPLSFYIVLS